MRRRIAVPTVYEGRRVLVVGAGNTGAEIALDLVEHGAAATLSVRTPVNVVRRDFLGMPAQVTTIRFRRLPASVLDRIGRLMSRVAFGDLARYGLPAAAMGPVSSIVQRGRIPIIDVGTVEAIKQGRITVKPGVARLTRRGAAFVDGSHASFDAVILATGYRTGLDEIIECPACSTTARGRSAGHLGAASTSSVSRTSRRDSSVRSACRPRPSREILQPAAGLDCRRRTADC